MSRFTHFLKDIDDHIFAYPKLILGLLLAITVFFAVQIPAVKMYSDFADLLPQEHPYIQLHNDIRDNFGGANVVVVGIEVEEGTIFTNETLALIHRLTQAVDNLPGINHNLVSSLTHRTTRKVWLSEEGSVLSEPYYDPTKKPVLNAVELEELKTAVLANPRVYGLMVSPDLKSALIKGQLNEGALDYEKTFEQIQQFRDREQMDGVKIHVTGQPVLVGWVYTYIPQIVQIFLFTILFMFVLLVVYFRRLYGVLIPMIGIAISSIWGIGILSLLGYNLDPLTLVIPFLISARAMSHGIQLVERYYGELALEGNSRTAARKTFDSLFRPGSLGVVSDAVGLLLISLGSIPINTKLSYYASLWAICVILNVLLMVPLLLSVLPQPRNINIKHGWIQKLLSRIGFVVSARAGAVGILGVAVLCFLIGGYGSSFVQIGESEPGSPLLYPDHDYNLSSKAINTSFPGSEELYIVARTQEKGGLKNPDVIRALEDFQAHMLNDPELGGAKGLPDLVKQMNRLLHNNDPRYSQVPHEDYYVGGLMFAYMASSPIPGALKEFVNPEETDANMVFFYKDHQGGTIRRAIHMVKDWIAEKGDAVEGLSFHLAGGIIGVTAAINEAVFETNRIVIPLVLGLIFLFVTFFYGSLHAGWLMFLAMSFATILSYGYMGAMKIGINVNTVPIIAVGIGVGIDYSIYIMDRIREEMLRCRSLQEAVIRAISTTGLAVCVTAGALILGVVMWVFLSDLRFQSDAALLLVMMLIFNMVAALFVVPSWITLFKPKFITDIELVDGVIAERAAVETAE
ncbi:efflux RND transporter permease subunit [Luteithermobacter gelatinilyticus]|uniref:efflux RND transporter permease subunit n=1 Tax=Luteithermobacter gelatinilyticus TaxID=2582913 RepID=UPI001106929A|nr:MMPL family transporter [Luteithermobacter gelatinilyticus]